MTRFVLVAFLAAFSFNSFAQFSLTCPEIYERTMISKHVKKKKVGDMSQQASFGGLLMGLSAPVVGLGILAGSIGMVVYSEVPSREEKVLAMKEEGSRQLLRFTKKLQKTISPDISSEEVMDIIKDGLESGLYCQNFPQLSNRSDVKEHVEKILKLKYGQVK